MAWIKCPSAVGGCDGINYINDEKDDLCDVCKAIARGVSGGSKVMAGTAVKFVFRRGASPESRTGIRELKVSKGAIHILAFDKDERCVGVLFSHDEKGEKVHEKAEIAFFERYRTEYGQWHRVRSDWDKKELLSFSDLQKYLDKHGEYKYAAYLNFVKKDN